MEFAEHPVEPECGKQGVPIVAQWLTNPTRNDEVARFDPCPCSVG